MHFTIFKTLNRYNNISLGRVHFVPLIKAPVGGNLFSLFGRSDATQSCVRAANSFILMIVMYT
jgi:hypothetical protein